MHTILRDPFEAEKSDTFFQKMHHALNHQAWFIRLTNKEYWHPNVYFIPLAFYIVYLAIRARSPFFFSAANPSIPTGGLVGENKSDISDWIPSVYRPKNILISSKTPLYVIEQAIKKAGLILESQTHFDNSHPPETDATRVAPLPDKSAIIRNQIYFPGILSRRPNFQNQISRTRRQFPFDLPA